MRFVAFFSCRPRWLEALGLACLSALALLTLWPELDLAASALFAKGAQGFFWRGAWPLHAFELTAFWGARALGVFLVLGSFVALARGTFLGLAVKGWVFLWLALLIGPGLVANVGFKDHFGRARPREVAEFGGKASFTPAFVMAAECRKNCSFISGDGAFGFFLPSLAYVVPPSRKRRVLAATLGLGALFGSARLLLGAHFLSDILAALIFMTLTNALTHLLLFGREKTKACWRVFLGRES